MKTKAAYIVACLALCIILATPAAAARLSRAGDAERPAPEDATAAIDFRGVDIRVIAKYISELTGKNFLFDEQVRDKVTVFSPTKVTPEEAYRLFENVLKVHGYTTVPKEGVINIVPSVKARSMELETRADIPLPGEADADRFVTQLVRLKYADSREMQALLQPLMDKTGVISPYESGNSLIITDYASNIDRLMNIVRAIDVPGQRTTLAVIPLQHASAKEMAAELQEILRVPAAAGAQPRTQGQVDYKVVADERTNRLIVMARDTEIQVIRQLAARLDVPTARGSDRIHVYFLENAVAEDLAATLNELTSQTAAAANANGQNKPPARLVLQEDVFITAEKATNSLIIRAGRQDYMVLADIIRKLDIQRAQVLVEAIIMEMTVRRANALGAEWRFLDNMTGSDQSAIGGTNLPSDGGQGLINQLATQPFAGPSGLVLGAAEGTITYGGIDYLNIGLLVQALEQDSEVNIISTPHLLTMDNEEASIVVGEERPFLKSSMTTDTGGTAASVTNTYEFKDLGLTLKITPHITQGDFVKLKIYQLLKSYLDEAETGAISSTKRETETTVQVRDGETVVIGGLIDEEQRTNRAQVPCLGDIPLLGWFAKHRAQSGDKNNLIILIRPKIIRNAQQLRDETREKEKKMERATDPEDKANKEFPPKGLDMLKD